MEEGLRSAALAAVVGEIGALPPTAGRRLQLACEASGITGFVLRRWRSGTDAARHRTLPSAAATRWRIATAPARDEGEPGIGTPLWRIELLRCRGALPAIFLMEEGDATGHVAVAAALVDRPVCATAAPRRLRRQAALPARSSLPSPSATAGSSPRQVRRRWPAASRRACRSPMRRPSCPDLPCSMPIPAGDAAALRRLAEWCGRYSPWTSPDGGDGILLDITGCAHLRGGEAALVDDLLARLASRGSPAAPPSPIPSGAAWAVARYGSRAADVIAPGAARAALRLLPVAALRLPLEAAAGLDRLGLKRIGDLYRMPRAALAQRFGDIVARRLDQALGQAGEPLSPLPPVLARRARLAFAEPIATPEDLARALRRLVADLCRGLAAEGAGARRLELACYRVDGAVERAAIGTARPSRDPRHLARLLEEKLCGIDPGLGIEDMVLDAAIAEPLAAAQIALPRQRESGGDESGSCRPRRPARQPPRPRPSRALRAAREPSAGARRRGAAGDRRQFFDGFGKAASRWPAGPARPVRLLAPPEPVEAMAPVPDDPPIMFRWRRLLHRVRRADGPERIAGEWWRDFGRDQARLDIRDYYRVEDEAGRRFWLFRAGLYHPDRAARWFVHGVFA